MMWCIPGTGAQGGSVFLRFALIVSRRQGQRAASTGTSSDLRGSPVFGKVGRAPLRSPTPQTGGPTRPFDTNSPSPVSELAQASQWMNVVERLSFSSLFCMWGSSPSSLDTALKGKKIKTLLSTASQVKNGPEASAFGSGSLAGVFGSARSHRG